MGAFSELSVPAHVLADYKTVLKHTAGFITEQNGFAFLESGLWIVRNNNCTGVTRFDYLLNKFTTCFRRALLTSELSAQVI